MRRSGRCAATTLLLLLRMVLVLLRCCRCRSADAAGSRVGGCECCQALGLQSPCEKHCCDDAPLCVKVATASTCDNTQQHMQHVQARESELQFAA